VKSREKKGISSPQGHLLKPRGGGDDLGISSDGVERKRKKKAGSIRAVERLENNGEAGLKMDEFGFKNRGLGHSNQLTHRGNMATLMAEEKTWKGRLATSQAVRWLGGLNFSVRGRSKGGKEGSAG